MTTNSKRTLNSVLKTAGMNVTYVSLLVHIFKKHPRSLELSTVNGSYGHDMCLVQLVGGSWVSLCDYPIESMIWH